MDDTLNSAYAYALASAFCFSLGSFVFAIYAKRATVLWMTAFKAWIAFLSFGLAAIVVREWSHFPAAPSLFAFFISGIIGLCTADLLLVRAFATIGSARTLLIFSSQPIALGVLGYLFFDQSVTPKKAIAILFLMACVFTLSFEKFKQEGRWEIKGPLFALAATILDACGIALTRYAFEFDRAISVMEGNFFRCAGAVMGFAVIGLVKPLKLWEKFKAFPKRQKGIVIAGSLTGTTISLGFFLAAVSIGHLATVSALLGAAPLFAGIWECLFEKRWPSKYLLFAFCLFILGFSFIL